MPTVMLRSENYQTLTHKSKALMLFMQIHWREDQPVAMGVREAMKLLRCNKRTAMAAFDELEERRFIVMVEFSLFYSRTESKARTWRLTWMPYKWQSPTREWEEYDRQTKSTGAVMDS